MNIAVHMIVDAVSDSESDLFVLLSSDTDQIPTVKAIADINRVAGKTLVQRPLYVEVWRPPPVPYSARWSAIRNNRIRVREISSEQLAEARFPPTIPVGNHFIKCHPDWE